MSRRKADAKSSKRNEREAADQKPDRIPVNNALQFWSLCGQPACRRARACVGDAEACFKRFWPLVPEEFKVWFRAGIKARVDGHSPREAAAIGDTEVVRWKACVAQYGAPETPLGPAPSAMDKRAASAPDENAASAVDEGAAKTGQGPRIRTL
jgi:hypothetical protein